MNELAGADLNGLDRFKARKVAVEKLTELGALEKEEPYTNNVGFSERADVPIEPRLSEQWFLKYPSVEKSRACVEQELRSAARLSPASRGASRGHRALPKNALPSAALGEGLRPLDGQHPGLVHQPPALVGTPDSGVESRNVPR